MRRSPHQSINSRDQEISAAGLHSGGQARRADFICAQCQNPLECVEQSRRAGSWLGSLICPNCRSEYLYAYRWGRLMRRS